MSFEKLRLGRRAAPVPAGAFQVVAYRPLRRAVMLVLLALVVAGAAAFSFWLGVRTSELDRDYLTALEVRSAALEARLDSVNRELTDVRLAQSIDSQAAHSLRETISELRGELAVLREEVTFYKSLMAPSSIRRGLQIAELELSQGEDEHHFTYRVLLTQAEARRDWVQGAVELAVVGVRGRDHAGGEEVGDAASVEEVLPLTELAEPEAYPLKFRFRYFQNLSGTLALPEDFEPRAVQVTLVPSGRAADRVERRFDWIVQAG